MNYTLFENYYNTPLQNPDLYTFVLTGAMNFKQFRFKQWIFNFKGRINLNWHKHKYPNYMALIHTTNLTKLKNIIPTIIIDRNMKVGQLMLKFILRLNLI